MSRIPFDGEPERARNFVLVELAHAIRTALTPHDTLIIADAMFAARLKWDGVVNEKLRRMQEGSGAKTQPSSGHTDVVMPPPNPPGSLGSGLMDVTQGEFNDLRALAVATAKLTTAPVRGTAAEVRDALQRVEGRP